MRHSFYLLVFFLLGCFNKNVYVKDLYGIYVSENNLDTLIICEDFKYIHKSTFNQKTIVEKYNFRIINSNKEYVVFFDSFGYKRNFKIIGWDAVIQKKTNTIYLLYGEHSYYYKIDTWGHGSIKM